MFLDEVLKFGIILMNLYFTTRQRPGLVCLLILKSNLPYLVQVIPHILSAFRLLGDCLGCASAAPLCPIGFTSFIQYPVFPVFFTRL